MKAVKSLPNSLTKGNDYQVVRQNESNTVVIDDQGFEVGFPHDHFESPSEEKKHTKSEIIQAYQEGFFEELPFIDGEKWYNEKFGNND